MRIPVSQADWPTAFNKVAKYIGRHWPAGKLKLNQSREITAKLFGYNSVHDVKQELDSMAISKHISLSDMINSMTLKSLVYFDCPPKQISAIFQKIPWKELSVWSHTDEAALETLKAEASQNSKYIFHDEFNDYSSYKSPESLIELNDLGAIPPYEYAVTNKGYIYRRSNLEALINLLHITDKELEEIGFNSLQRSFVIQYLLPKATTPIKDSLGSFDYKSKWKWDAPYMVEVKPVGDDQFVLYHEGFNAYYPGKYNFEELKDALVALYSGENLPASSFLDVEVDQKKEYKDMEFQPIPGTGSSLEKGSKLVIDGQTLIRTQPIKSYKALLDKKLVVATNG